MKIPNHQFELRQQPLFPIYFQISISIFVLSLAICMPLALMAGKFHLLFFPVGPFLLSLFASFWLLTPCVVNVEASGFSTEVKRSSIGIPSGKRAWVWAELSSFEFLANRNGVCLVLKVNGTPLVLRQGKLFSSDELRELRNLLREYFPEKEKKSFLFVL